MANSERNNVHPVDRRAKLANSGKLPKSGGSRRSDRIRAIADDLADEGIDDVLDDLRMDDLDEIDSLYAAAIEAVGPENVFYLDVSGLGYDLS